jgi:hypothetical protein
MFHRAYALHSLEDIPAELIKMRCPDGVDKIDHLKNVLRVVGDGW